MQWSKSGWREKSVWILFAYIPFETSFGRSVIAYRCFFAILLMPIYTHEFFAWFWFNIHKNLVHCESTEKNTPNKLVWFTWNKAEPGFLLACHNFEFHFFLWFSFSLIEIKTLQDFRNQLKPEEKWKGNNHWKK